jgi:hypothetical protein
LKTGVGEYGGMAEWLKAPVLKTGRIARFSWVRIPLPPPTPEAIFRPPKLVLVHWWSTWK